MSDLMYPSAKSFHRKGPARITLCLIVAATAALSVFPRVGAAQHARSNDRLFTFSWPFHGGESMAPRGGTSRGAPVNLAEEPSPQWRALQEPGLTPFERDRRAILAMAGDYRASFDFIETVGFAAGFEAARPYQSWGTERIYVVEDTGRRIVLQHIMAMFIVDDEGAIQGPFVQKHWRQEWEYEPASLHVFDGGDRWRRVAVAAPEGRWGQTVFQVDDSPRYAAMGRWEHNDSFSAWLSDETWRPLPRRESSVRSDYSVLVGTNRHTILPTGWTQEEENLKTSLPAGGRDAEPASYIARELGVNRYQLIEAFDFSAADEYWKLTEPFWADVRSAWRDIFASRDEFSLLEEDDGVALWQEMFDYAAQLEDGERYNQTASERFVKRTLARYVR